MYIVYYIYTFPGGYTVIDMKISSNNHTPPKINKNRPCKNGGWKTILSFGGLACFQGLLLSVLGRASRFFRITCLTLNGFEV